MRVTVTYFPGRLYRMGLLIVNSYANKMLSSKMRRQTKNQPFWPLEVSWKNDRSKGGRTFLVWQQGPLRRCGRGGDLDPGWGLRPCGQWRQATACSSCGAAGALAPGPRSLWTRRSGRGEAVYINRAHDTPSPQAGPGKGCRPAAWLWWKHFG